MTGSAAPAGSEAWVALGANLGDRVAVLDSALRALAALPGTHLVAASAWYEGPAVGGPVQPDFLNGVARLQTRLGPLDLLDALLAIETRHGRVRSGERNAPRRLDLDLLWHAAGPLDHPHLSLPHPRIAERAFVLQPWLELAPAQALPGIGRLCDCWSALGAPALSVHSRSLLPSGVVDV